MPHPLDEYPIHQAPLSVRYPATSDRNFYDRCYFNAHDRTGDLFLVTGFGVYPNLGVTDAYATVRRGDLQHTVRFSDALGDDRMTQAVGGYRLEVLDPLRSIRIVCDETGVADGAVGFDLTWTGSFPAVEEQPHTMRTGDRIILDACRFAQVGTWSGELRVAGETLEVTPDRWVGTRDRSWGIRPVGEADPPGRFATEQPADWGFWWLYLPLRFVDFAVVIIAQEDGAGHRTLNDAVRVWPEASGRAPELLGWPDVTVRYRPGTRDAVGATVAVRGADGEPFIIEVTSEGWVALNAGPGYGGDPDWSHGAWRGRGWSEALTVDVTDPSVTGRAVFGVVDHVGRAVVRGGPHDGAEGWGLFEHGTIGAHAPSGFVDLGSVAGA